MMYHCLKRGPHPFRFNIHPVVQYTTEADELAVMPTVQTGGYCVAETLLQQLNKTVDSCVAIQQLDS